MHAKDSDGYTPLHRASYSNHVNVISYLLSVGSDIHSKTELGWTPLHSACKWNNYAAAARLLAAGADPGALSNGGNLKKKFNCGDSIQSLTSHFVYYIDFHN